MSSSISATISATASAATTSSAGIVDSSGNSSYKIVGICLAVASGVLIGSSFVIKKKGLLASTVKYGNVQGEGHGYLKSWVWWAGMITMILGEICNFVAYAFTEAILVTPMGALSVVICAILSHFILKEKLTFFGWIGCTLCIIGAVILALNAPEQQSVSTISAFKKMFLSPGFLVWAGLCIAVSLVIVFFVAPRWGKKNMMPYISICSLIGGISVSCTQGLGASIVTSIKGDNQVKNWFFWFLFVFVVVTLLTEINYLNKALELFNTSMVVPVYFCFFSSATLITSFILFQGLKASAVTLITMVLGFLVTCLGITLLQLSKVDPTTLDKLDRKSTILMQAAKHQTEDAEKGEVSAYEDPGMDALRGGFGAVGSIIRARSVSRRMSSASSMGGKGLYAYNEGNLSTHGLGNLQRFQLSDAPMPSDAMDQISLHSAKSPSALSPHAFASHASYFPAAERQRSKSHLKFEEADVVHQYHYGSAPDPDATHTYRPNAGAFSPVKSGSGDQTTPSRTALLGYRHPSTSGSIYPPVPEEDEEMVERGKDERRLPKILTQDYALNPKPAPANITDYSDPYANCHETHNEPSGLSPHKGLSGLFHFHSGPDLTLHTRGRKKSHREESSAPTLEAIRSKSKDNHGHGHGHGHGKKDYPQISKKNRDADQERSERAALVPSDDDDEAELDRDRAPTPSPTATEATHVHATIGVGQRVHLRNDSGHTTPIPQLTPTKGVVSSTKESRKAGPGGPRKLPDIPGFAAGPKYQS